MGADNTFEETNFNPDEPCNINAVSSSAVCRHIWDKETGKWEQGRPHIGIKGRWLRTCTICGAKESFSRGMFNGWYSAK
jgi:hypothetical protein